MTFVVNKELGFRLENAEIDALCSRLTAIQEINGNPMGVEYKNLEMQQRFQ